MTNRATGAGATGTREFVISRIFKAPLDRVWRAFAEGEQLRQWWPPDDAELLACEVDFRAGGFFHYGIRGAAWNFEMWAMFRYLEIEPQRRITYIVHFSDRDRGVQRAPFDAGWPLEMFNELTFEEADGGTRLTLRTHAVNPTPAEQAKFEGHLESMHVGYGRVLDQLERHLGVTQAVKIGGNEFVVRRAFDAPRELLWRAWSLADDVAQWWGPHGFTNPRCDWEPRPGGRIHIDMRAPDGTVFPRIGEFREAVEGERMVFVSHVPNAEGVPIFIVESTVSFAGTNGRSEVVVREHVKLMTEESRPFFDGMESGWSESFERLTAHLAAISGEQR